MVKVGFVVEGASDKKLIDSAWFRHLISSDFHLELLDGAVIDAGGNGQMCRKNIGTFVNALHKSATAPDKIIVLADLDPEKCAPCITARKQIIDSENIDLIVIARKALEAWFLADTQAMREWLGQTDFYEEFPEDTPQTPWQRLKEIAQECNQRGPGSKIGFVNKFIQKCNFDLLRAAEHPNCPSARYFVDHLRELA